MKIKLAQIIACALAIEVLAVIILVAMVAVLGPAEPTAAKAYAAELGYWVGPIAGFALCLLGGWLMSKRNPEAGVKSGLVLGATVAVIDISILYFSGTEFEAIFAISNIGRVLAGYLGGLLAVSQRA